jgi:hypothetical protein
MSAHKNDLPRARQAALDDGFSNRNTVAGVTSPPNVVNLRSPVCTFDYDTLDATVATSLREQAAKIRAQSRSITSAIIEIGRDLLAVKQNLSHGRFCSWVKTECGFTTRTAANYMRAAAFAEGKLETVSNLAPAVLYKLATKSTPGEIVTQVMARAKSGETVSDGAVGKMLAEALSVQRRAAANQPQNLRHSKEFKRKGECREPEVRTAELQRQQDAAAVNAAKLEIIAKFSVEGARFIARVLNNVPVRNMSALLNELENADDLDLPTFLNRSHPDCRVAAKAR